DYRDARVVSKSEPGIRNRASGRSAAVPCDCNMVERTYGAILRDKYGRPTGAKNHRFSNLAHDQVVSRPSQKADVIVSSLTGRKITDLCRRHRLLTALDCNVQAGSIAAGPLRQALTMLATLILS